MYCTCAYASVLSQTLLFDTNLYSFVSRLIYCVWKMTTAHRPTWKAAVGKAQEGGWSSGGANSAMRSVLAAPSHTKLKVRNDSSTISKQKELLLKRSLLKLKQIEEKHSINRIGLRTVDPKVEEEGRLKLLTSTAEVDDSALQTKYNDADDVGDNDCGEGGWSDVGDENEESDLDRDNSDDDDDDDDFEEDDDSEDDEEALQRELTKIRAERERVKAKEESEVAAEENLRMEEAALVGNPLLNSSSNADCMGSGKLKRRWNDDVVFRNQAKGEPDLNRKRFINDTVRNDFHKRFLNKFIK